MKESRSLYFISQKTESTEEIHAEMQQKEGMNCSLEESWTLYKVPKLIIKIYILCKILLALLFPCCDLLEPFKTLKYTSRLCKLKWSLSEIKYTHLNLASFHSDNFFPQSFHSGLIYSRFFLGLFRRVFS